MLLLDNTEYHTRLADHHSQTFEPLRATANLPVLIAPRSSRTAHIELADQITEDARYLGELDRFSRTLWQAIKPEVASLFQKNIRDEHLYRRDLKVLIYNLARSLSDPINTGLAFSLSPQKYGRSDPFRSTLSYDRLVNLLYALANFVPGDKDRKSDHEQHPCWVVRGFCFEGHAEPPLLCCRTAFKDEFARAGLLPCPAPDKKQNRINSLGVVRLSYRPETKNPADHDSRKEPKDQRRLDRRANEKELKLDELTKLLRKAKPDVALTSYADYKSTLKTNDRSGLSYSCLASSKDRFYRIFSDRDGSGGRIFGHWLQAVPSKLRHLIRIEGQPVVEYDYRSMQLCLAYSRFGMEAPSRHPYAIPGFDPVEDRKLMKLIFTISIGCGSGKDPMRSIPYFAREAGYYLTNTEFRRAYDAFWDHHQDIISFRCSEAWRDLQYDESEIALDVIGMLVDQEIPCLPIHDCARR